VIRVERVAIAVAVVGAVTVPWWSPWALGHFGFFAARRIEVRGARYLAPATIVAALGLKSDASVWSDTKAMERGVGSLSGVRSVDVSRRFPSTLVVTVSEVEPVALAQGPAGLVPVDEVGRPLPYDPADVTVDVPVVVRADARLLAALATVRATDLGLFADVVAARAAAGGGGAVVLELEAGRLRLGTPLDPAVVRAVAAVRRDLAARGQGWEELDGRFHGWVVVRRAAAPARPGRKRAA
jgi:cell division septal protein FtsQ